MLIKSKHTYSKFRLRKNEEKVSGIRTRSANSLFVLSLSSGNINLIHECT